MKNGQKIKRIRQVDDPFMESMGYSGISVPTGTYHLIYDNAWDCVFVSDDCLEMMSCSRENFLELLQASTVLIGTVEEETSVVALLNELSHAPGKQLCTGTVSHRDGKTRRIKITLTSFHGQDGRMHLYGQMVDITQPHIVSALIHEYWTGLERSGKIIYRYILDGRRAVIPEALAKRMGIPEVIDNLPEWSVEHDRIAPESMEAWLGIFDAIHRGEKYGSREIVFLQQCGAGRRHFRVEFISISGGEDTPVAALVSHKDITDQYEHDRAQSLDRAGLLQISRISFPEIVSMNLTKGTYRIIQYYSATTLGTPQEGPLDQMLIPRLENVAPEDQEAFKNRFFPDGQLKAIREGRERMQLTYRRRGADGVWHWMESIVMRQENPYDDDILTFAVSRNVDQQKAQEQLLRQALDDSTSKLEGWLYYNSLSSQVFPGLIYINYEDGRPSPYSVGKLAERLDCPRKELAMSTCFRIPEEDKALLRQAYEHAKKAGERSFHAEYRVHTDRGETAWVNNHAIYFEDKDGGTGYIHFLTDTTHEHTLTEQVRIYMEERLAENEKIFDVVAQHSDRTLCYYNIKARRARPWNEEDCKTCSIPHMCFKKFSLEQFEHSDHILPDSISAARRMFQEIHNGTPFGEAKIHIKMPDAAHRWLQFKYSGFLDGEKPVAALLSYKDVTERHEQELAYQRYVQSIEFDADGHLLYIESDLTSDRIEKLFGQMLKVDERNIQCAHSDFGKVLLDMDFQYEKAEEASRYFSREHLLALHKKGQRQIRSEWQVRLQDGALHWLDTDITLMSDPYNGNIKAFFRMVDITEEYEAHQSVLQRADYDAMTGLLRRDVGEALIRKHLADRTASGGILIALDLDDLKGINDTLGHAYGDKAITSLAETLKSHFRKDDILIRAGGDEFMAFLPGAGKNVSSVELSVASLLRKLSCLSIGDNNDRAIHCSIGCAVELPDTDTFDLLYQRADTALYHVKRNGKNNFAFFEPAMLEDNYQFKVKQAFPVMNDAAKGKDLQCLLEAVSAYYPGVVMFNLSQNYFHILSVGRNVKEVQPPATVDVFWKNWQKNIHPDDQENTLSAMSRANLLTLYTQGQRGIRHYYRNLESVGYVRTEIAVHLYTSESGDICAFLFFRWSPTFEKEAT